MYLYHKCTCIVYNAHKVDSWGNTTSVCEKCVRFRKEKHFKFLLWGSIFESKVWQLNILIWLIISADESAINELLMIVGRLWVSGKSEDLHVRYVPLVTSICDRLLIVLFSEILHGQRSACFIQFLSSDSLKVSVCKFVYYVEILFTRYVD